MTKLPSESPEQSKEQLKKLVEETPPPCKELEDAGIIELSDDELAQAVGGFRCPNENALPKSGIL